MSWLKLKKVEVDAVINELFDQGLTPHIVTYTDHPEFIGPTHLANDNGFTIFSLGLKAVRNYDVNEKGISFDSSFGGKGYFVDIPYSAIIGVTTLEDRSIYLPFEVSVPEEPEVVEEKPMVAKKSGNVIEMCPGAEPWRNPNANPNWAKNATVK
ncbi:hypothetical protein VPHD148_0065 [Vibrio phage D148]